MVTEDDVPDGSRLQLEWWKIAVGAVVTLICLGGLLRLATKDTDAPGRASAEKQRQVALTTTLPGVTRGAFFATDGDLASDNEPLWVFERSGREITARRMKLQPRTAQATEPVTFRLAEEHRKRVVYDVTRWGRGAAGPVLVTVSFDDTLMTTNVQEITPEGRVVATGEARVPRAAAGTTRNVAVVRYDGQRPDVIVIDRGVKAERAIVTIVAGERQFTTVRKRFRLPLRGFAPPRWLVDFAHNDGPQPEMFAFRLGRSAREDAQFFMAPGEGDFPQFTYSTRLAIGPSSTGLVIAAGTRHGAKSAYVLDPRAPSVRVRVVQLVDETPVL